MKKSTLIILLAVVSVSAFAQKRSNTPAVVYPKSSETHALKVYDGEVDYLLGSAEFGFDQFIHTTEVPANQIPKYKVMFTKLLDRLYQQRATWQAADKATADSLASVKAKQDSINKAKAKPKN